MSVSEEEEGLDVGALLSQPLLLQSPLQAVLEKLFARLSSQAATIARLEAGAVQVAARLDESEPALAVLQARVDSLQALDARLAPLAAAAAAAQAAAESAQAASAAACGRLAVVEERLEGTENLAGRGIAVDRHEVAAAAALHSGGVVGIADLLGVVVPQVQPLAAPRAPSREALGTRGAVMEPGAAGATPAAGGGNTDVRAASALEKSDMMHQPEPAALEAGATAGKGRSAEADGGDAGAGGAAGAGTGAAWAGSGPAAVGNALLAASQPDSQPVGAQSLPGAMPPSGSVADRAAGRVQQTAAAATKGAAHTGADDGTAGASAANVPASQRQQQPSHLGHVITTHVPASLPVPVTTSHGQEAAGGGAEAPVRPSSPIPAASLPPPAAAALQLPGGTARLSALGSGGRGPGGKGLGLESPAVQRLAGGRDKTQGGAAAASPPASPACWAPDSAAGDCSPSPLPLQQQGPGVTSQPLRGKLGGRSEPARRMVEVVNLLRWRPHLAQSGLLWKLQASLSSSVAEQEHLQGEVEVLRSQLAELSGQQAAAAAGVQGCAARLDGLERAVGDVAATLTDQRAEEGAGQSPRAVAPLASVLDLRAVEQRVDVLGGRLEENGAALRTLQEAAAAAREASAAAARLLRSSTGGSSRADALEALQAHLLAQQERLAAQVEAAAEGVRASVPGAVAAAVGDASRALERRLTGLAASKQELAALAARLAARPSRDEVERMLHALQGRGAAPPPPAGEGLPAAGVKLKCLSCDGDLRPVHLASAAGGHLSADMRYSTLPAASPARAWAPPTALERPSSPALAPRPGQGSLSGAPLLPPPPSQQHRAGFGAPVGWMHRMRRGGEGGQPEGLGAGAARPPAGAAGEAAAPGLLLALQPPPGASWDGGAATPPAESLSQLVREAPPPPPGLEQAEPPAAAAGPAPLQRPKTSLPSLGSPARHGSPRIPAARSSTPAPPSAPPTAPPSQHSAPPACADQPPPQPPPQQHQGQRPGGGLEAKLSAATTAPDPAMGAAPGAAALKEAAQAIDT